MISSVKTWITNPCLAHQAGLANLLVKEFPGLFFCFYHVNTLTIIYGCRFLKNLIKTAQPNWGYEDKSHIMQVLPVACGELESIITDWPRCVFEHNT